VPRDVLILATRYDRASACTFEWARELHDMLLPAVDTCLFLDVTGLSPSHSRLDQLTARSTHILFYGHGEPDWWTELPGSPGHPLDTELIGTSTVHTLASAAVYSVSCSSLKGLGAAHAGPSSTASSPAFVGYDDRFRFDYDNRDDFKKIINQSAYTFVLTGNATQTVLDLRNAWTQLANDFAGPLRLRPNAVMAGSFAQTNAQRIGSQP